MRYVFIVNPAAGKENAAMSIVPVITRMCKEKNIQYTIEATQYPGHGELLAREFAKTGEQLAIYACGGDGTLHEVINGVYGYNNVVVGCIPCGTGNDFVRNFGEERDFLPPAAIFDSEEIKVDLMQTQTSISIGICSAGIDASVAYGIPKYRRIPFMGGTTAYRLSIVENLLKHIGHQLAIRIDEEYFNGEFLMVTIANGVSYGGGFFAAPNARVDDGELEVILIKKMGRARIAKVLPTYQKGIHFANGKIIPQMQDIMLYRKAKKIKVTSSKPFIVNEDGECHPRNSLEVSILGNKLRFIVPKQLAINYKK